MLMIDRSNLRPHICHTSVLQLQRSRHGSVTQFPAGSTADWVIQQFAVRRERRTAEKRAQRRQEAGERRRRRNRFRHLQVDIGAEARSRAESQAWAYAVGVAHANAVADGEDEEDAGVSDDESEDVDDNGDDRFRMELV